MPTAKTECTELSVGFGLLQCDPLSVTPDKAVKLWDGTLNKETFLSFIAEYQNKESYYRKFYLDNVTLNIRSHSAGSRRQPGAIFKTRTSWVLVPSGEFKQ